MTALQPRFAAMPGRAQILDRLDRTLAELAAAASSPSGDVAGGGRQGRKR